MITFDKANTLKIEKDLQVNIQTKNVSIANPDTIFEKMISNPNKSLEIVMEDPYSPVYKQNKHYVEMSLFNTFYQDDINFKNYIRDVLHARYTNVAAKNELMSDEKEIYSRNTKLVTIEEKIDAIWKENGYLKGVLVSYQKVIDTGNSNIKLKRKKCLKDHSKQKPNN